LPDHVQVFPGHGAGSACGKALGALPSTTVGYERKFAWWATYLARDDEQGFIDELLDGQPDAHAYFARMKRQNKQGPAILGRRPPRAPRLLDPPAARDHPLPLRPRPPAYSGRRRRRGPPVRAHGRYRGPHLPPPRLAGRRRAVARPPLDRIAQRGRRPGRLGL